MDFELLEADFDFYKGLLKDELPFFNEDVTVSQLYTMDTQILKENIPPSNERFVRPLTGSDIKEKQKNAVPVNTKRSNNWAVGLWREWAVNRNRQPETQLEVFSKIPSDIGDFSSYQEMNFWLQRFICEIRRKNGDCYPPQTLQNIASDLQRYLRVEKSMNVNFLSQGEPTFIEFRKTLDSMMRELTNNGIGIAKRVPIRLQKTMKKHYGIQVCFL